MMNGRIVRSWSESVPTERRRINDARRKVRRTVVKDLELTFWFISTKAISECRITSDQRTPNRQTIT
jgi:hypothetical protein